MPHSSRVLLSALASVAFCGPALAQDVPSFDPSSSRSGWVCLSRLFKGADQPFCLVELPISASEEDQFFARYRSADVVVQVCKPFPLPGGGFTFHVPKAQRNTYCRTEPPE